MNWNASNYRQRKAERLALVKPAWFTNPDTGEQFYLRPVRAVMSSVLAGSLPSGLAEDVIDAWKKQDVPGMDVSSAREIVAQMAPEQLEEGARETRRLSLIIQEACVVPLISNVSPDKIVFTDEWKAQAIAGLKELNADFDPETFDPKLNVIDPREMDESDVRWLFKWAAGLVLDVELRGGEMMPVGNLSRFPKKLNRGTRTRKDGAELRKSA